MPSNGLDTAILTHYEDRIIKMEGDVGKLNTSVAVLGTRLTNIDEHLEKISVNLDKQSDLLTNVSDRTIALQARNSVLDWAKSNWWILIASCAPVLVELVFRWILKK